MGKIITNLEVTMEKLRMEFQWLKTLWHARMIAIRRRIMHALKQKFNPYPTAPPDVSLSPSLRHRPNGVGAEMRLDWTRTSIDDVTIWQNKVRSKLIELTGYGRFGGPPAEKHSRDCMGRDGLKQRSLFLKVRDGLDLSIRMVWSPEIELEPSVPIMICLQGTNSGMHLSWGEARMPADPIKIYNGADIACQAAIRGFLAVCLEQSCFGERREQKLFRLSSTPCIDAANHALLLGRSLIGERASDVSSTVNWLCEGNPGFKIDKNSVYIMGSSAGGTTALFSAAMDERISGVIASSCIGFIKDTLLVRGDPEGQNVVPGILRWFELDAVVSLVAPRPFLTVSGDQDHIWPFGGAKKVIDAAQPIFDSYAAGKCIDAISASGGHNFYPEITWPGFARLLRDSGHKLTNALNSEIQE